MTDEEFRLLRDLIRDHCGVSFADDSKFLVERRLLPRLEALRLRGFTDYYRYLRYASDARAELDEIVERVTTNETYFFRERFQHEILPALHARGPRAGGRLHLWSAGCSTGEEAYTIAMLVRESGLFAGWEVRVFGSDVSRRVIAAARRGIYGRSSFRATDERHLARYFHPVGPAGDVRYQVNDDVRAMVHFGLLNLIEDETLAIVGEMDAIFCRNVLIYFDQDARRRVVAAFHRKLGRGGYLLLGHLERDMVYRKP